MIPLAIHCGRIAGGFGCDMGDLPAPPAAFAYLLYALAIVGGAVGIIALVTGRLPKIGRLRRVSDPRAGRMMGLVELLVSAEALVLAVGLGFLSRHLEPPHWLELLAPVLVLAAAVLDWQARQIDRRQARPTSPT